MGNDKINIQRKFKVHFTVNFTVKNWLCVKTLVNFQILHHKSIKSRFTFLAEKMLKLKTILLA